MKKLCWAFKRVFLHEVVLFLCDASRVTKHRDRLPRTSEPRRETPDPAREPRELPSERYPNMTRSFAECRAALLGALKRLTPLCDANRSSFADCMATAQQLQALLCSASGNLGK